MGYILIANIIRQFPHRVWKCGRGKKLKEPPEPEGSGELTKGIRWGQRAVYTHRRDPGRGISPVVFAPRGDDVG